MFTTIHQPYFFPWLGYFSKLAYSSSFVVLDDVYFRKRHYIDRVKIVNMHGEMQWVNLPVGQNHRKELREVYIADKDSKHVNTFIRTIESSYARAKCYQAEWGSLKDCIVEVLHSSNSLVDTNIALIKIIANHIGLPLPNLYKSSSLLSGGSVDATERIVSLLDKIDANKLLLGDGMSCEVHDLEQMRSHGVEIFIQDYKTLHPTYSQFRRSRAGFLSGLSVLDSLLNVGREKTLDFIKNPEVTPRCLDKCEEKTA